MQFVPPKCSGFGCLILRHLRPYFEKKRIAKEKENNLKKMVLMKFSMGEKGTIFQIALVNLLGLLPWEFFPQSLHI